MAQCVVYFGGDGFRVVVRNPVAVAVGVRDFSEVVSADGPRFSLEEVTELWTSKLDVHIIKICNHCPNLCMLRKKNQFQDSVTFYGILGLKIIFISYRSYIWR